MQRVESGNWHRVIGLCLVTFMMALGLGLSATPALAKSTGKQLTQTERATAVKKDKQTLKSVTLNAKGLSKAWKAVLQHKIKVLKQLKKTVAREKGRVYTTRQAKMLTTKINKLNKKYTAKLQKLKHHKDPANIHYAYYINGKGDISFMKEKLKRVGNRVYIVWGINEHNGKFTNYGGHGSGFTFG